MEKIILYVDDAAYARQFLAGLTPEAVGTGVRQWVLVACPPRMTRRISKWVSHSARENWRSKWFAKVEEQILPLLQLEGGQVRPILAKGPLPELTQRLKAELGSARVLDARRPKFGVDLEPVAPDIEAPGKSGWALPGALLGMGALLVLANELSE
jgi:hypothetical protein